MSFVFFLIIFNLWFLYVSAANSVEWGYKPHFTFENNK